MYLIQVNLSYLIFIHLNSILDFISRSRPDRIYSQSQTFTLSIASLVFINFFNCKMTLFFEICFFSYFFKMSTGHGHAAQMHLFNVVLWPFSTSSVSQRKVLKKSCISTFSTYFQFAHVHQ